MGVLAVAVTAAAAAWAVAAVKSRQVRPATVASRSAVVGTWKVEGGDGWIRLGADGRFRAVGLPAQVFTPGPWADGVTSATGAWALGDSGGWVPLKRAGVTDAETDYDYIGLGIVETGGATRLCVGSGDPGVLCDFLLRRASA
ncbi:hypothetical protein [Streptomyces sp. JNUCC 63]